MGIGVFTLIIGVLLIALPFVYIPKTVSQAYQVPQSSSVFDSSFIVPPATTTQTTYLNAGDNLNIQVTVTGGGNLDIDFSVNDGSTTYLSYSRATTVNKDWTVPLSSNYNFVYDNSFSTITSKDVTVLITKNWTTTAYRDVTTNNQLIPFEFAYLGIALALVGVGLTIFGVVKKEVLKTPLPPK
ncbi:MAG: emp24/gp25L/p24 family protein [Candidatus Bathyarchaeia archaeon]